MAYGKRLLFDQMQSATAATIAGAGANYTAINSSGFSFPVRVIKIDNTTDADMKFTIDGTTDHFMLPASTGVVWDGTANQPNIDACFFGKGTIISAQYIDSAPGTGRVYVQAVYGKGD